MAGLSLSANAMLEGGFGVGQVKEQRPRVLLLNFRLFSEV